MEVGVWGSLRAIEKVLVIDERAFLSALLNGVVAHQFGKVENEASQTSTSNKSQEKSSNFYKEEKELANGRLCRTVGCIFLLLVLIIVLFFVHIVLDEKIKGNVFSTFSDNIIIGTWIKFNSNYKYDLFLIRLNYRTNNRETSGAGNRYQTTTTEESSWSCWKAKRFMG